MTQVKTITDLKFLNKQKTIIQANLNNNTLITIEQNDDIHNLFDRCISGEFGAIDESFIEFNLNEELSKQNIIISRMQAKIILLKYGILEKVENFVAEQPAIIQLVWKEASQFEYLSPTIQALKINITLPDGSLIEEEQWRQMFLEAKEISF
jgi:hypothetical protein